MLAESSKDQTWLTASERGVLASIGERLRLSAGTVLFNRGDAGDLLYVIESGTVRLNFGGALPDKLLMPGQFFGELALFIGTHARSASAQCETDCELLAIGGAALGKLSEYDPSVLSRLMSASYRYLVQTEQRLLADLEAQHARLNAALQSLKQTQQALSSVERLSQIDELTGLLNRRGLHLHLEGLLALARSGHLHLALLLIDVDAFKRVNDDYGHRLGDDLLRALGRRLALLAGPRDLATRLGGDEFALLLSAGTAQGVTAAAHRIAREVLDLRAPEGLPQQLVGFSIGACIHDGSLDWNGCYERADQALYQAKNQGGHRLVWSEHAPPRDH